MIYWKTFFYLFFQFVFNLQEQTQKTINQHRNFVCREMSPMGLSALKEKHVSFAHHSDLSCLFVSQFAVMTVLTSKRKAVLITTHPHTLLTAAEDQISPTHYDQPHQLSAQPSIDLFFLFTSTLFIHFPQSNRSFEFQRSL